MLPIITHSMLSHQHSLVAASTSKSSALTVNCNLAIKSIVSQCLQLLLLQSNMISHTSLSSLFLMYSHFNNFVTPMPPVRSLKALIPIQMMNSQYVTNDILCQLMQCTFLAPSTNASIYFQLCLDHPLMPYNGFFLPLSFFSYCPYQYWRLQCWPWGMSDMITIGCQKIQWKYKEVMHLCKHLDS